MIKYFSPVLDEAVAIIAIRDISDDIVIGVTRKSRAGLAVRKVPDQ